MNTTSTLERFEEIMHTMRTQPRWGERNKTSGTTKKWVKVIRKLLECLSGGDVPALLRGTVGNSVLWKSVVPTTVGEKLVKMETGDRREVMQSLAEEGWTHKHILEAAIPFKRTAWFNRDQQPAEIGRPRKICLELEQVVDTEYRASSSETSIVMKRLSKQRNSTVTIQNVLPPHGSIYANSVLKGVVSHTTYRRMRPDEYRKLARRTDVCNYCLAGQGIRKKLTKLIKGVERKSGYSSVVWNAARTPGLILQLMVSNTASLPSAVRPKAAEYISQLVEIDMHIEEFRRQNAVYAELIDDPEDSLVVTLDYKEKGTLPQVPEEPNSHFYEQGKYSCLGFCIHSKHNNSDKVEARFVDFLMPHTNQDAAVTHLVLKKFWEMDIIKDSTKRVRV